jgi:hypothetical protein
MFLFLASGFYHSLLQLIPQQEKSDGKKVGLAILWGWGKKEL